MLLRWLMRPSAYERPRRYPSQKKLQQQQQQQQQQRRDSSAALGERSPAGTTAGDKAGGVPNGSPKEGHAESASGITSTPAEGVASALPSKAVPHGGASGERVGEYHSSSTSSSDCDSDDEPPTRHIECDDSFRGGRVHFFRQVPQFFVNLECFLAFTGMCLVQITLECVTSPVKVFIRRFAVREVLTAFYVLSGVASLYFATPADSRLYSSVYHIIRASSTIKLYVIFNMLEMGDKLLSAFNTDIIEATWTLVQSRRGKGPANPGKGNSTGPMVVPPANPNAMLEPRGGIVEITLMLVIASLTVMLHTIVLLCHVACINVAVNSEGSSLIGLLISNNFVEVKSVVFKKNTPESLLSVVGQDAVEGVQHIIFIVAMLLQHVLTSEGPGSLEFGQIALIILCEVAIDFVKHVFVARFNCIRLEVYRNFLNTCFLDVSLRRFLAATRLPVVPSYVNGKTDLVSATTTYDLSHAYFIPNPAHRCAFVPFPYASLLLWAAWPAVHLVLFTSPFTALLCGVLFLSVNALLKTLTLSWAAAYTYTLIRKEHRPATTHGITLVAASAAKALAGADTKEVDAPSVDQSSANVGRGAGDGSASPTDGHGNTPAAPASQRPRVYVVVDVFTQSLLGVDRFDLQAGKAKKK